MPNVIIFGEDHAHEVVLCTLIRRLATKENVAVDLHVRSATGGHGRMLRELKNYVDELIRGQVAMPDLFVVARDANCNGYAQCARTILEAVAGFSTLTVLAIPDPHIERWLMIDPQAFKAVLGQGCKPPDQKCDRDRYKQLLDRAVRDAGVEPLLGGVEFAEDIIEVMHIDRAARMDPSFNHLIRDLRAAFQQWKSA